MRSILLVLCCFTSLSSQAETEVANAFKKNEIDLDLSIESLPVSQLQVKYGSKSVEYGNELRLSEVADVPVVEWSSDADTLYTLIKVDPDALSRKNPIYRSFLHWLVVNVPNADVDKGQTVIKYRGAGAPPKTGLHRYVFLVYKQKTALPTSFKNFNNAERKNFDLKTFVEEQQLEGPLFGNFYQAQHEN